MRKHFLEQKYLNPGVPAGHVLVRLLLRKGQAARRWGSHSHQLVERKADAIVSLKGGINDDLLKRTRMHLHPLLICYKDLCVHSF